MTTNDDRTGSKARLVAVSSTGEGPEAQVDPRFGRCTCFVLFDAGAGHRTVRNEGQALGNGAGIQAAQQMADLGVEAVLTGDVGPNAFRVLAAAGVRTYVGCRGTVGSAFESYKRGELRETGSSTSPGHHGHGPRGQGAGGR